MSKSSDAVKKWRQNTKQRMIDSMGGKCQICGYNKCNEAMEFHHLDPKEKEFSFGSIRANCKSWEGIVEELKKCVLLCNRCHSELHYGLVELPEKFDVFNEEYADYKAKQREENFNECPVCHTKKNIHQKTCSLNCAAKLAWSTDWSKIDLSDELKQGKSYSQIAEQLDVSLSTVKKRCERLNIDNLNKFRKNY